MKRVILDTDVGTDVDDALALAMALRAPELDLHAVTTVHGNAALRAAIARRLLALGGRDDVPVVGGRSEPLRRSTVEGFHWHGLWGHEGAGLLAPDERDVADPDPRSDAAARCIADAVTARPGELSIIAVGPLTNIARAIQLQPDLPELVGDLTIMGGLVEPAGFPWAPQFETNLNADPGAAEVVLRSGAPITLVPIEVTLRVFLTAAQRQVLTACGAELPAALGRLIDEMREPFLDFSSRHGLDGSEFDERTYMHDPLAVYAAGNEELVAFRRMCVDVTTQDGGVLRTRARPGGPPNMRVCVEADGAAFARLWLDRVTGRPSPQM